ncbi:MAG: hypothetical protein H7Y38_02125 [Armatimonadetes bacterium]|nr:hypothetical protein [Armatimonadota bacterium]
MNTFPSLFCIIALSVVTIPGFASRPAAAQASATAPVKARQAVTLEIANKDGLVTVREEDGAYRFAQLITTPDLRIDLNSSAQRKITKISLRDSNGKLLYQTSLGDGGHGQNGFSQHMKKGEYTGIKVSFTPEDESELEEAKSAAGSFVLGTKNYLLSGEFRINGKVAMRAKEQDGKPVILMEEEGRWSEYLFDASDERTAIIKDGKEIMSWDKDKSVISAGGKEVVVNRGDAGKSSVTVDGKEIVTISGKEKSPTGDGNKPQIVTLDDGFGKMTMNVEKINGKTYHVLRFGKRRVLVKFGVLKPEFGTEGEIRIVPETSTAP